MGAYAEELQSHSASHVIRPWQGEQHSKDRLTLCGLSSLSWSKLLVSTLSAKCQVHIPWEPASAFATAIRATESSFWVNGCGRKVRSIDVPAVTRKSFVTHKWWSRVSSHQRRSHRYPTLQPQCLEGRFHVHFRSPICVKDNWSLHIGVDTCTLEHSVPGQGKYWHNSR